MYATCLYCTRHLGANAVLETLPIGRRVAFDEHQGRLWVICGRCEKWNLVPFDTRLETIDACERLFADARLRYSTANIGIARLGEGLELVRIGAPQRPEFAAWRYGDQFGRRRTRYAVQAVAVTLGVVALAVGGDEVLQLVGYSGSIGTFGWQGFQSIGGLYRRRRAAVRISMPDGTCGVLTHAQLAKAALVSRSRSWLLNFPMFEGARAGFAMGRSERDVELRGADAMDALGTLLPRLNASGGSKRVVEEAVNLLESQPDFDYPMPGKLKDMDKPVRLALEMAAHEGTERTALAGELKLLERKWKEAEEVARIADSLAVSDDLLEQEPK